MPPLRHTTNVTRQSDRDFRTTNTVSTRGFFTAPRHREQIQHTTWLQATRAIKRHVDMAPTFLTWWRGQGY